MADRDYSQLEAAPIRDTIDRLRQRVTERFPDSGLSRLAGEMVRLADRNTEVITRLRRPVWWLRAAAALALTALLCLLGWAALRSVGIAEQGASSVADMLQGIDAAVNELIFLSFAIFFLMSLETRFKRRHALRMLHSLRGAAHVIDMHQLTKDPEQVLYPQVPTVSSPQPRLGRRDLGRYLEYCSEMFSLLSKLAALHTQYLQDPVVLAAVNDVESLTSDLSRKVWQKITILDLVGTRVD
jgi:hypothetical protein